MCCSSQSFPGVKLTKKSLILCVLLTNLVFLGQSLLAQGTLGGSSSPTAVPASSEGFGATIFWVGAAIFACVAAAGGIILARKLHQQKALVAAGAVPAPAPRKLFSLPANGNGNGHGNGNGSRSLKLNHKPAKAAKFSNHTNGNNSKRRRMFNYSKFYTEMVLQGPSPTSSAESNYAYNGYNGYYVEYESPRINNNGNGHGNGNGNGHTNGNGNGHSNGNGANGHDHHASDSAAESNVARAAHADLLAGQKSLIEEQQRLIHDQARLIEEKSRLIAEKNQLLDRQSQMIDNNLL